jgi:hypothetical protein
VNLTARQNNVMTGKNSPLWPLLEAVGRISTPQALMRDIMNCINEDGQLADSASEQVSGLQHVTYHVIYHVTC